LLQVTPAKFDTPVIGPEVLVEDQWIDYNDHLNMAYYNVIFDRAVDVALEILGCGEDYRRTTNMTVVTAEAHVTYIREVKPKSTMRATFRLVGADSRRIHIYQELFHQDGWLAAASENVMLHVDLGGLKVTPFPNEIAADIATMLRYHRSLPKTKYMGRVVGIG
jgi:acyl-CoA thioester hydrolase